MTQQESWIRRFHDCLNEQLEKYRDKEDDEFYAVTA